MSINDTTYGFPVVRAMQAEIDRLRAELADMTPDYEAMTRSELRARAAEAAIARVRELILADGGDAFFEASEISRALDGGTE